MELFMKRTSMVDQLVRLMRDAKPQTLQTFYGSQRSTREAVTRWRIKTEHMRGDA